MHGCNTFEFLSKLKPLIQQLRFPRNKHFQEIAEPYTENAFRTPFTFELLMDAFSALWKLTPKFSYILHLLNSEHYVLGVFDNIVKNIIGLKQHVLNQLSH